MDIHEAISGRRSVRTYRQQAVDESTIRRLITAATQAPSAVNQQPWFFTVARDQSRLDQISQQAKAHMLATMSADLALNVRPEHFRTILADPEFHIFYHAPVLILISATAPGPWIVENCSLAAENLMLTAYALGLGTCWIGFAQRYLNTPAGKLVLGLPEACVPVAPLIVGYPGAAAAVTSRREPDIQWVG